MLMWILYLFNRLINVYNLETHLIMGINLGSINSDIHEKIQPKRQF